MAVSDRFTIAQILNPTHSAFSESAPSAPPVKTFTVAQILHPAEANSKEGATFPPPVETPISRPGR